MIEIQMAKHDVPHVVSGETQPPDLTYRGHLFAKFRLEHHWKECRQATARIGDIAQSKARIDQHESLVGFDQQTMAREFAATEKTWRAAVEELPARRTTRYAVEVMNTHATSRKKRLARR
ncbi:hypothetical protein AWB74_08775 [Caballeronia arvi]|uniref:Uncharacterized protein n=1 Tax=Caballeronia arvi TaxID=1777135 RepID=A0A158L6F4_9BURK|nr:hypothetical protein AWB74_08775 [Caballeronia arvi]